MDNMGNFVSRHESLLQFGSKFYNNYLTYYSNIGDEIGRPYIFNNLALSNNKLIKYDTEINGHNICNLLKIILAKILMIVEIILSPK